MWAAIIELFSREWQRQYSGVLDKVVRVHRARGDSGQNEAAASGLLEKMFQPLFLLSLQEPAARNVNRRINLFRGLGRFNRELVLISFRRTGASGQI